MHVKWKLWWLLYLLLPLHSSLEIIPHLFVTDQISRRNYVYIILFFITKFVNHSEVPLKTEATTTEKVTVEVPLTTKSTTTERTTTTPMAIETETTVVSRKSKRSAIQCCIESSVFSSQMVCENCRVSNGNVCPFVSLFIYSWYLWTRDMLQKVYYNTVK